jgi:hypothetical protein
MFFEPFFQLTIVILAFGGDKLVKISLAARLKLLTSIKKTNFLGFLYRGLNKNAHTLKNTHKFNFSTNLCKKTHMIIFHEP